MSRKQDPLHTAETVIDLLGESVLAVHGRRDATFSRVATLDTAGADAITFCKYSGPDAIRRLAGCKAAVVLCGQVESLPSGPTVIVTADPRNSFVQVVAALFAPARRKGIHPTAVIDSEAVIDPDAYVGPHAVIGRCRIG